MASTSPICYIDVRWRDSPQLADLLGGLSTPTTFPQPTQNNTLMKDVQTPQAGHNWQQAWPEFRSRPSGTSIRWMSCTQGNSPLPRKLQEIRCATASTIPSSCSSGQRGNVSIAINSRFPKTSSPLPRNTYKNLVTQDKKRYAHWSKCKTCLQDDADHDPTE
jgi:hypothetical protein